MAKTKLTMENVSEFLGTLSFHEFKSLVEKYSKNSKHTFDEDMQKMVSLDLQDRLKKLGINAACPNCSSVIIVKNGKRANGIQEYKCTECNRKFTIFTGTILEKTRWHWDVWIKVLELTLNNYSIERAAIIISKNAGS